LFLWFNPRRAIAIGLVLIEHQQVPALKFVPELRQLSPQNVLKTSGARLKARVGVQEYYAWNLLARPDPVNNDSMVLGPVSECVKDNFDRHRGLDCRDCTNAPEVPNNSFRQFDVLAINYEWSPFARPIVGDLQDVSRMEAVGECEQDSPLHQISIVSVPLISHDPILSA